MSHVVPEPPARGRRRSGWLWPLVVCLVTAGYTAIPFVLEPQFYQRGDTAAQFAPTWYHLGELVRSGTWPVWLDPESWAGGNYAAEALFGTYSPINLLVWVGVSLAGDLAVATYVVKALTMVALALGTYLLAREYDAAPWAAASVAVALPFSGFTLFWDAGSWPAGLMAFAYTPWVWLTFRRALRGTGNPFWAFLAGALAVLNGNPYGTLAVIVVGLGMVCEGVSARLWTGLLRVLLAGLAVAALLPLVYLPLLEASDLAVRSTQGELFENTGKLRPTAGDLFALSSPLHVPPIKAITGPMQVPATYLAWFVLPLLPWLRWDVLRTRGRELVGAGVISLVFLALSLGPSKLWLFRWPLRVIEYAYLGVLVVLAVLLTQGLARSAVRGRLGATALVVGGMGYLSWAQDPPSLRRVALGMAVVAVLTALLLAAHLVVRRGTALAAVAIGGIGLVLGIQVALIGENASSRVWHVPSDLAALQADFADREGRVMQFADLKPLQDKGRIAELEKQWDTYLPGSMHHPAGVDAVNNYTGMGFLPFMKTFCMEYDGLTQPCGYRNLWKAGGPGQPPVADLMKLDTVVVQRSLARGVTPGEGWTEETTEGDAIVLRRGEEQPFAGSELSWASDAVEIASAETVDRLHQRVEVDDAPDGGTLVFSTLAWPGWSAELDGEPVAVRRTPVGLLTLELPPGASGTLDLTYRVPGLTAGLAGAGVAVLLAALLAVWGRRTRVTSVSGRRTAEVNDQ